MQTLSLDTAAARIREARRSRTGPSPYFFLVGAGVSVPSVPLAWRIAQDCRERAERLGLATGAPPEDPAGGYSYWLEQAFPDPDQRRAYFRSLIEDKPISDANLRLAHLLAADTATNVLVTTNFDDFVARALSLFGQPFITCDHPATTARLDLQAPDVQIVHVHGTYWFYDLVNTEQEITERALGGMRSGPGMGELLGDLLRLRTPLVVGYSGWEGDVVMTALRKRLEKRSLRHTLYWFCFTANGPESLPRWLREHPNVSFVVPDGRPSSTLATAQSAAQLPADRVFDALLRAFTVEAPPLTRDPLAFFANRLRAAVPPREATDAPDLYYFDDVIRRIEHARSLAEDDDRIVETIEKVRDAVRRGRYALAAQRAGRVQLSALRAPQVTELLNALWPAVVRGGADPGDDLKLFEAYVRIATARPSATPANGRLAHALIGRVGALRLLGKHRKAVRAVEEAFSSLGESASRMPRASARLRLLEGQALAEDRREQAAIEVFEDVARRYGRTRDVRLLLTVMQARRHHARLLAGQGDGERALRLLAANEKRLDGVNDPTFEDERDKTQALRRELEGSRRASAPPS